MLSARAAIVSDAGSAYPRQPPFSPSEKYPEYPFADGAIGAEDNPVYRSVRRVFAEAKLDEANVGLPSWNPLGRYVRPGSRVFVLCNFADDLPTADRLAWRLMGYRPEALKLLGLPGTAAASDLCIMRNGHAVAESDIEPVLGRPFQVPRGWRTYLSDWTLR